MKRSSLIIGSVLALAVLVLARPAAAQESTEDPVMQEVVSADLAWGDIEVPGFLPGLRLAPVYGDPAVADRPYTLRLYLPDAYNFPPHWHPQAENVTVLEGTLLLAMGSEFDETRLNTYGVGDYLYIAAEHPHFGGVRGDTVLQLHGTGPFEISVVEGQGLAP